MTDVAEAALVCNSGRSPYVQHAVGVSTPETLVALEVAGAQWVVCSNLMRPHVEALPAAFDAADRKVVAYEDAGFGTALSRGVVPDARFASALAEFCSAIAPSATMVVPPDFPVELADALAERGIRYRIDRDFFDRRRRTKTPAQITSLRDAQRAAEAALTAIRDELRARRAATAEDLRRIALHTLSDHRCIPASKLTIAPGRQSARLHEAGSGAIAEGVPVLVDVYPRHLTTGYWGDITRTFCVGPAPPELTRMHETVHHVLTETKKRLRAGLDCAEIARHAHTLFREAGFDVGDVDAETTAGTFPHLLGHGLGLDLHERPFLDIGENDRLQAGDVVTIEPGLYKPGFGGVRIEDLVVITESGYELLTDFPYELEL